MTKNDGGALEGRFADLTFGLTDFKVSQAWSIDSPVWNREVIGGSTKKTIRRGGAEGMKCGTSEQASQRAKREEDREDG